MFNLAGPPDFRGLDPYLPVTVYYRHLPHWRQERGDLPTSRFTWTTLCRRRRYENWRRCAGNGTSQNIHHRTAKPTGNPTPRAGHGQG